MIQSFMVLTRSVNCMYVYLYSSINNVALHIMCLFIVDLCVCVCVCVCMYDFNSFIWY